MPICADTLTQLADALRAYPNNLIFATLHVR